MLVAFCSLSHRACGNPSTWPPGRMRLDVTNSPAFLACSDNGSDHHGDRYDGNNWYCNNCTSLAHPQTELNSHATALAATYMHADTTLVTIRCSHKFQKHLKRVRTPPESETAGTRSRSIAAARDHTQDCYLQGAPNYQADAPRLCAAVCVVFSVLVVVANTALGVYAYNAQPRSLSLSLSLSSVTLSRIFTQTLLHTHTHTCRHAHHSRLDLRHHAKPGEFMNSHTHAFTARCHEQTPPRSGKLSLALNSAQSWRAGVA